MKIKGVPSRNSILLIHLCHCTHAHTQRLHTVLLRFLLSPSLAVSLLDYRRCQQGGDYSMPSPSPSQNVINVILQYAAAVIRLSLHLLTFNVLSVSTKPHMLP